MSEVSLYFFMQGGVLQYALALARKVDRLEETSYAAIPKPCQELNV